MISALTGKNPITSLNTLSGIRCRKGKLQFATINSAFEKKNLVQINLKLTTYTLNVLHVLCNKES